MDYEIVNKFLLAGHLGGTKARLCLIKPAEERNPGLSSFERFYQTRYSIGNFQDLLPLVKQFLKDAEQELTPKVEIQKVCLAVAGPVKDNKCKMTNWSLEVDGNLLAHKLVIKPENFKLINDFQAVAYGIKELKELKKDDAFVTLQEDERQEKGLIVVIGASTGLRKSFLVQSSDGEQAYATEGGHPQFAPRTDLEFKLSQYIIKNIRDENNRPLERVSVERVVSGRGIVSIYRFLRDYPDPDKRKQLLQPFTKQCIDELQKKLSKASKKDKKKILQDIDTLQKAPNTLPEIEQMIKIWQEEDERCRESVDPAAVISSAALAKRDPLCMKTMQMFVEAYGAEAGNCALQFLPYGRLDIAGGIAPQILPYGGLYIAGGIAPQILPLILEGSFMRAFFQKGRMSELLKKIPLHVVKNLEAGLIGAARYAATKM